MRTTFASELEKIMEDRNTYLLTGDLGFSVFEKIKERFEEQYLNMGLSEQNMLGVAAGMALTGRQVFVYSIIPFIIYRPFEQLRNDICFQNLRVRLVGVGAGLSYSDAGFTHHAIEDYGILCSLPNITVLSPSDPIEVSVQMKLVHKLDGPSYMRLGRNGEPVLHDQHKFLIIGKALEIFKGDDILFIATGSILGKAIEIAKLLEADGKTVEILNYHTIKPFDENAIYKHSSGKKLIVTFEEHLSRTGLYSLVVQCLMDNDLNIKTISVGIKEPLIHSSGSREYLLSQHSINVKSIYEKIKETLKS